MRRGDIEIRIRGGRFADLDAPQLLGLMSDLARRFPGRELVKARATSFILRQKPETTPCHPKSSPQTSTATPPDSPTTEPGSSATSIPSRMPREPEEACESSQDSTD